MIALVPGTFDPFTLGHADIVARAAGLFDEVVVAVLQNTGKEPWFEAAERESLTRAAVVGLGNVRVDRFDGLLVQFARSVGAQVIIKGLRTGADFEYERTMAQMNRMLAPTVETVYLAADPRLAHVSSSLVREVAWFGGSIEDVVPVGVAAALRAKVEERKRGRHHRSP